MHFKVYKVITANENANEQGIYMILKVGKKDKHKETLDLKVRIR